MKANAGKCHLLYTRETNAITKIREFDVKSSREEKLITVKIDNKLSFENHIFSQAKNYMHSQE